MELNEADMALSNSVTVGAYTAVRECAKQFRYDRWNCPMSSFFLNPNDDRNTTTTTKRSLPFARITPSTLLSLEDLKNTSSVALLNGLKADRQISRETALVRAMTSAGITFTLTKNCSTGDFANCVCDTRFSRRKMSFKWGGCSDNFHFGSQVAGQFLDGHEDGADPISLVNLHNNAAGRMAVKKTMRRICKCHGVSGSCATQTCWRQISDFRSIGNYLKKIYKKAMKVGFHEGKLTEQSTAGGIQKRHPRGRIEELGVFNGKEANRPNRKGIRDPRQLVDDRDDYENTYEYRLKSISMRRGRRVNPIEYEKDSGEKLKKRLIVFLDDSPDYCKADKKSGYMGVLGRRCSSDPSDPNAKVSIKMCTKLCRGCGLKARKKISHVYTSCKCQFRWCCDVTCESCRRKKVEIICVKP